MMEASKRSWRSRFSLGRDRSYMLETILSARRASRETRFVSKRRPADASEQETEDTAVLWVLEDGWFGLIVPAKTGIYWENQTGGILCDHPKAEGVFVPLPSPWLKENPDSVESAFNLSTPFSPRGNFKIVEDFLKANPEVGKRFEWDGKSRIRAQEAWLPVRVKKMKRERHDWDILRPFYGKSGILTYSNSD